MKFANAFANGREKEVSLRQRWARLRSTAFAFSRRARRGQRGKRPSRVGVCTSGSTLHCRAEFVPWKSDFALPGGTDIVINGTSIGLYDAEARLPLDTKTLKPGQIVADVVFSPPVTRLLRDASASGCKTLDGLSMLVNQGVLGVQYWTGVLPDAGVMHQALGAAMGC